MKKMTSKLLHKSNTLRGTIPINNSVVNYIFQQPTPSKTTASATTASATTASATTPSPTTPPIVLIGGTSQTIASLLGHHTPLANISGSGLLQYELRGQGKTTTLPLDDCSLARHVEDFDAVLDYHSDFTKDGKVDLCGFSFGGRVALAIAAERPHRIRKIVCTGVPADRGATGRLILKQWLRSLERGDLTNFIWQSISDGHSERFLNRHESRLKDWVASAVASNSAEAIHAIVGQTHTDDIEHPYHTINLAQKALENGLDQKDALFLVGDQDRIASPKQCEILANLGHWKFDVIQGAGHSVPIEQPRLWRDAVKGHLGV